MSLHATGEDGDRGVPPRPRSLSQPTQPLMNSHSAPDVTLTAPSQLFPTFADTEVQFHADYVHIDLQDVDREAGFHDRDLKHLHSAPSASKHRPFSSTSTPLPLPSSTPASAIAAYRTGGLKQKLGSLWGSLRGFWSSSRPMFYSHIWDPPLIITQIIAMQAAYWFIYGASVSFSTLFFPHVTYTMDSIFLLGTLSMSDSQFDWVYIICLWVTAFASGALMSIIVDRSKKCLDFSSTAHIIHFIVCLVYSESIPGDPSWWVFHMVSLYIMTSVSFALCRRFELGDIPLP